MLLTSPVVMWCPAYSGIAASLPLKSAAEPLRACAWAPFARTGNTAAMGALPVDMPADDGGVADVVDGDAVEEADGDGADEAVGEAPWASAMGTSGEGAWQEAGEGEADADFAVDDVRGKGFVARGVADGPQGRVPEGGRSTDGRADGEAALRAVAGDVAEGV